MILIWLAVIFLIATALIFFGLFRHIQRYRKHMQHKLELLEQEEKQKQELFAQLGELTLGFTSKKQVELLETKFKDLLATSQGTQTRIKELEAELQQVQQAIQGAEQLQKEFEVSSKDSERESELLNQQEKEFLDKSNDAKSSITETLATIDSVSEKLLNSGVEEEKLSQIKQIMQDSNRYLESYTEGIQSLNQKYLALKKAYDALDIEYAQLYEMRNE